MTDLPHDSAIIVPPVLENIVIENETGCKIGIAHVNTRMPATVPDLVYPWKRFWYPRGEEISLVDSGFLVDPEGEYGKYYSQGLKAFEALDTVPCVVLLREPGIGKTIALDQAFQDVKGRPAQWKDRALWLNLRDYSSEGWLDKDLVRSEVVGNWLAGDGLLYLFLDSVDEGLLNINSLAAFLAGEGASPQGYMGAVKPRGGNRDRSR